MLRGVSRRALRLGALLWVLTPCASVLAHGEPPAAYSVLSHDAQGARALRLSKGLALRRAADRFQYICPSAWGDMYAAPAAALADGTLVVDSTSGLKLLSEDGKVRAHPDPAAAGDSNDVVRGARGVFSLRTTQAGSELLAVDAEHVRVLWRDTKTLYSLAPVEDKLVLLRAEGTSIEQVTVAAADGSEIERQVAVLGSPVDYAYARAAAGTAYALVEFRANAALGNLHMNTFTKLAGADLTIAGPLRVGDTTLVALDGQLSQLVDGGAQPLADSANVLCLDQENGLAFACHPEGIARIAGQALSEPLFAWSWLFGPDLTMLAEGEARDRCNAQWQDFRVDLLAVGITLPPDAPAATADAGAPTNAAITDGGGAAQTPASVDGGQAEMVAPRMKENASCAALPQRGQAVDVNLAACVLLLTLVLLARAGARSDRRSP